MKIGIIGYGVVGRACGRGFEKIGHEVRPHDLKLDTKVDDLQNTDLVYICVPTPLNNNGSCDTTIVEKCINELSDINYEGLICIKSTVEPGTTIRLSDKYNFSICFVPEFLRERSAYEDFVNNHDLLAIGCSNKSQEKLIIESHGDFPRSIKVMNPTEAELLKYFSNVYNSLKIIFANNIFEITKALEVDYSVILDAYSKRAISNTDYLDANDNLRGYGGVCLPKDTLALSTFIQNLGIDLDLIKTIHDDNQKLKITVFEGMRSD